MTKEYIIKILDNIKKTLELLSPVVIGIVAVWKGADITTQTLFVSSGLIYALSYAEEAINIFGKK